MCGEADREAARALARRLAEASLARGDATGWFEELYARAAGDATSVPWGDLQPSRVLIDWLDRAKDIRDTDRALVVGCGLGDDAEELARRGLAVIAFDVSPTAVAWCRRRFPRSRVDYVQADLLALPADWRQRFDLVIESNTLQALPPDRRAPALTALADGLAPGGTLLVLARGRRADEPLSGPPWPLLREELSGLVNAGLVEKAFDETTDADEPAVRRFRAVYRAPAPGPDGVHRFDNRVDDYVRHRPGYPPEVVELLRGEGLPRAGDVADIGSGTGKLSEAFLRAGYRVTGIEPNEAMRAAAVRALSGEPRFRTAAGTAEATGLPDRSADAIVAGQAFHWFEPRAARREFARVLRPGGLVALIWNDRRTRGSPILKDYETLLLRHAPQYPVVQRGAPDESSLAAFFAPCHMTRLRCENSQVVDWDGLLGRVMSASYVPLEGPDHDALVAGLRASFERGARDGRVTLLYDTRLFVGRLSS